MALVVAGLLLIVGGAPLLGAGITSVATTSSIGGTAMVVGALAMLVLGILTSAAGLAWGWLAWRKRSRGAPGATAQDEPPHRTT